MPQPPGYVDQVNGIIKFIENPCHAPWTVYLELAAPAAGRAALRLLDFGLGDVVRGALRPRGLRSSPHGRRRRPGGRRFPGIPEIGNLIGQLIPGSEAARGRQISNGARNLWLVDGALQRALWWWLVADVTLDFAFEWTSAIQQSEFCTKTQKGYAQSQTAPEATWFSPANVWTSIVTSEDVHQIPPAVANNAACWCGGRPFSSMVSFSGGLLPPSQGEYELRVTDSSGDTRQFEPTPGQGFNEQEIVGAVDSSGGPMNWQYRTNGGVFQGQATVTTFET